MLGPWSMAARLRGCHCRGCFRTANIRNFFARRRLTTTIAAAKRATGASTANPRRRRVIGSDIYTACYATLLGAATVVDVTRKDDRRRYLDRRIEEAKNALDSVLDEAARLRREEKGEGGEEEDEEEIVLTPKPFRDSSWMSFEALEHICRAPPERLLPQKDKMEDRRETLIRLEIDMGWDYIERGQSLRPLWHTGTSSLTAVTETLLAEEAESLGALTVGREPTNELQIDKVTNMVNLLIDALIFAARFKTEEDPWSDRLAQNLESAHTLVRLLRGDGYPRYMFPNMDPRNAVLTRCKLDELNRRIMTEFMPQSRMVWVTKICYNLLVCGFPPSIQNYNTLIWGFTELGEHDLAWAVVESLLFYGHLRPTKGTVLALLAHFRMKRDIEGFYAILKRMTAVDNRGIGLGRRPADDGKGIAHLRKRADECNLVLSEGVYVEIMPIDRMFIEAVAEGLVDFGSVYDAAILLVSCLREGWMVNLDILDRFLRICADQMAEKAAAILIEGFLEHIDEAIALIYQLGEHSIRKIRRIFMIWDSKSQFKAHERMMHSGWDEPPIKRFKQLLTALWLQENVLLYTKVNESIQKATAALKNKDTNPLHSPLDLRLERANSHMDDAIRSWKVGKVRLDDTSWLAKVHWIHETHEQTRAFLIAAEYMVLNFIAKAAMPGGLRTSKHYDQRVPIATRVRWFKEAMTPGTWRHAAATCFTVKQEVDFAIKCILFEVLPDEWIGNLWDMRNARGDICVDTVMRYTGRWLRKMKKLSRKSREAYWRGEIQYSEVLKRNKIRQDEELGELQDNSREVERARKEIFPHFPPLPAPLAYQDFIDEAKIIKFEKRLRKERRLAKQAGEAKLEKLEEDAKKKVLLAKEAEEAKLKKLKEDAKKKVLLAKEAEEAKLKKLEEDAKEKALLMIEAVVNLRKFKQESKKEGLLPNEAEEAEKYVKHLKKEAKRARRKAKRAREEAMEKITQEEETEEKITKEDSLILGTRIMEAEKEERTQMTAREIVMDPETFFAQMTMPEDEEEERSPKGKKAKRKERKKKQIFELEKVMDSDTFKAQMCG
ncbi:hypothetical protein QBC38DRAFT_474823 [Podospora fimiseda]|uniref:Pentatricopeptide repeat-containing protein n=1 Tax=Podospora fimiseda TaxID=252190 RepID=A0AAN7BS65_9PEZI|nr:hypothetical protein QBC38DRAFT_474823 [Podospora fimiseda]